MLAKLVCVDGNLTVEAIDYVCQLCHQHHIPGEHTCQLAQFLHV